MRRIVFLGLMLATSGAAMAKGPHPALTGMAAAADDASVAGSNPAGMTRFDERVMRGELLAFFPDNTWEGQLGSGPTFQSTEDDSTVIPSGNMVMPFRDNYWFGFTILGSGFSEDFGETWPGRYFVQDYDLVYISAFPSIATKVNDQWSVAGSLAITYTSYEQNKAVPNVDPGAGDGKLNIDTGRSGVTVPRDAILRFPDGRVTVWVVDAGGELLVVREQVVRSGSEFDGVVEITNGLADGDVVVVRGNEMLQEGQAVSIVDGSR